MEVRDNMKGQSQGHARGQSHYFICNILVVLQLEEEIEW